MLVLLVLELPNVPHVHVVVAPPGGDDEHPVGVVLEEGVGLADDENLGDSPPGAVEHVDLPAVPPPAHLEEYVPFQVKLGVEVGLLGMEGGGVGDGQGLLREVKPLTPWQVILRLLMSAGSRWDMMAMARWGVGPKTEVRLTGLGLISFGEAIFDYRGPSIVMLNFRTCRVSWFADSISNFWISGK